MVIGDVVGLAGDVIGLFSKPKPTPEEQRKKAGVWYLMLADFVNNEPTSYQLANKWQSQLPFSQNSTKQRFMDNNIRGKSGPEIIDTLVGKINDELTKGGFEMLSKAEILAGIGGGNTLQTGGGSVSGTSSIMETSPGDINESRNYFYLVGLGLVIAGLFAYSLLPSKKRKRR